MSLKCVNMTLHYCVRLDFVNCGVSQILCTPLQHLLTGNLTSIHISCLYVVTELYVVYSYAGCRTNIVLLLSV